MNIINNNDIVLNINNIKIEIVEKYGVVCLERTGTDLNGIIKANEVLSNNSNNIHVFSDVINDISSTKIRFAIFFYYHLLLLK